MLTDVFCYETLAEVNSDGQIHYKLIETVAFDLLMDPAYKDHMDYHFKPLFHKGKRLLGPYSSGATWESLEKKHPNKTIVPFFGYYDWTEFYKGHSAEPFYGVFLPVQMLLHVHVYCPTQGSDTITMQEQ